MSILNKATTGRRGRAQKVVVYAPEGFGKSTLAGRFPNPIFFDIEGSSDQLDVKRLTREELPSLKEFESALSELAKERPYDTVIVDTIDWLEQMVLDAIIAEAANDKIKGIEDFGYGKGYTILKERMTILLSKFDRVIAAGINVVLLAHAKVTKFEPPDGVGPYDRYELKLTKQVAPLIKEWADMLVFGNWRTQVREKDKNEAGAQFKGVGGKERLMYCNRTAAWDAKNRHGMGDVEKWDIAVIEKAFRAVNAPWGETIQIPNTPIEGAGMGKSYTSAAVEEKRSGPISKREPLAEPLGISEEIRETKDDEIPGIPNPPAKEEQPPVDADLARICEPHADAINEYLRNNKRVAPNQTWRDVPADFAARVKKNPAGFLKVVGANNGKVVAA